jgi:hypothetical protein
MELLGSQKSYQLEFPGRYSFTLAKNLEISGEITKWIKNVGKTGRFERRVWGKYDFPKMFAKSSTHIGRF